MSEFGDARDRASLVDKRVLGMAHHDAVAFRREAAGLLSKCVEDGRDGLALPGAGAEVGLEVENAAPGYARPCAPAIEPGLAEAGVIAGFIPSLARMRCLPSRPTAMAAGSKPERCTAF